MTSTLSLITSLIGIIIIALAISWFIQKKTVEKASKKIVLIDGKSLADYMIEYNVGVSEKKVYEVKKIDSDYFEE